MSKILIKDGEVFQEGNFSRKDVLISHPYIMDISPNITDEGALTIDASGKRVIPGFIDVHTHGDWAIVDPRYTQTRILQGVTSEIVGNCGFSVFPDGEGVLPYLTPLLGKNTLGLFHDFDSYAEALENTGLSINVGSLIGDNTFNLSGGQRIQDLIHGTLGFSTGLDYYPGQSRTLEELLAFAKTVAEAGSLYVTHFRSVDWFKGLEELISIMRGSGCRCHISHLKPFEDRIERTFQLLNQYDVTYDTYPFAESHTSILSLIPKEMLVDSVVDLVGSISDKNLQRRIIELHGYLPDMLPWENITVLHHPNPDYIGMTIHQISKEENKEPWQVVFDIIQESQGDCSIMKRWLAFGNDEVSHVLSKPRCIVASDSLPINLSDIYMNHPRLYSTFRTLLKDFVGKGKMTMEEAILKSSILPAEIFRIKKRGSLKIGNYADVLVMDPTRSLTSAAEDTARSLFEYVIVNGLIQVDNYTVLMKDKPGMVIRG